jgi:hypothetical protein
LGGVISVLSAVTVLAVSAQAYAGTYVTGFVSQLEMLQDTTTSVKLGIQLNGDNTKNYYAFTSPPSGCNAVTTDTIKNFKDMATTALISGRPVGVYYNSCGGSMVVYDVILQ